MVKDEEDIRLTMECPYPSCNFVTAEIEEERAFKMLEMHEHANHVVPVPVGNVQQQVRPEKVRCPQLVVKEGFVTEEAFNYFEHAWKEYKTLAAVTTAVKQHLSSCLGEEVSTMVYSTYGKAGYEALYWRLQGDWW